jgi:hypothetical protein
MIPPICDPGTDSPRLVPPVQAALEPTAALEMAMMRLRLQLQLQLQLQLKLQQTIKEN